uniref:Uncharacterized protein n=1 Tax=Tanacetum cinerariifolium TaxID=118510 RepID=A0A6L2K7R2_TANCI|nr:hypothetical protein [Tanacetum cinerariifolium]
MPEMLILLKELTVSRTPKKVLMREEARHPITKNVNSISLIQIEEGDNNGQIDKSIMKPGKYDEEGPLEGIYTKNEVEIKVDDELAKRAREKVTKNEEDELAGVSSSHDVRYYLKHRISEKLIEGLIEHQKFNDSLHKVDEKRPFILGTPFLTIAKAVIKFYKGRITLISGKSKISFHSIPEPNCRIEKGIRNDIEPIAPTMTVNRLVLEWEEKIKLHQEKEMKFDQWRSKIFNNEHPASMKEECEVEDKREVT